MTTQQTCPHCGAERNARKPVIWFECGTTRRQNGIYVRDWVCCERQIAAQAAEIEWVVNALRNLVNDSQHKDHDCGDTPEHCPVLAARAIVKKYGKR